jgi:hypothetical protein
VLKIAFVVLIPLLIIGRVARRVFAPDHGMQVS